MSFKSFNKLTNILLHEIPFESKRQITSKMTNLQTSQSILKKMGDSTINAELKLISDMINNNKNNLSEIISTETGKYQEKSLKELEMAINFGNHLSENSKNDLRSEIIKSEATKKSLITYRPLGSIFSINNDYKPFWHIMRNIMMNFKIGNTSLVRPGEQSSLISKAIDDLLKNEFPFFEFLYCDPKDYKMVIRDDRVKGVYFNGNLQLGSKIGELGGRFLKPVVLETGSSNPIVLLDDKKLDKVVVDFTHSRMDNFGFGEENIKKAYIPENLKKTFVKKLKKYLESEEYIEKSNKFLNDEFLFKTQDLLESVSNKEYNILMGDPLHPNLSFKHPLILEVKDESSALLKNDDLYGPIFIIKTFEDKEILINDINKSHFKYSMSIYGEDLEDIEKEFVCSNIFVNCLPFEDFNIPKGGLGHSGFGKINGRFGMKSFVNVKTLFVNK